MQEKINNNELHRGDEVVCVGWLEDKTDVRLPPNTKGQVMGKGSIKDWRVAFEHNGARHTLEVNRDEIELADGRSERI